MLLNRGEYVVVCTICCCCFRIQKKSCLLFDKTFI